MTKQEDSGHSFLAYFKRATSPLAVLRILSDRPMYGYELIQELKQRSGGKYQLSLLHSPWGAPHRTEISHKILPPDVIRQVSHNPLQKFSLTLPLLPQISTKPFRLAYITFPFKKQGPSSQYF